MESNQKNFKASLAFGVEGEHEIAEALLKRGAVIMPFYQFKNLEHAPVILKGAKKLISPDLICFSQKTSECFMVEVKTKNQWVKYFGSVETGIDKRVFDQYKEVQDTTGVDIYLFFNHKVQPPTGIFWRKLEPVTRYWDGCVHGQQVYSPMMFYGFNTLTKLHDKQAEQEQQHQKQDDLKAWHSRIIEPPKAQLSLI